jgi:hypothetical protein
MNGPSTKVVFVEEEEQDTSSIHEPKSLGGQPFRTRKEYRVTEARLSINGRFFSSLADLETRVR